MSQLAYPGAVGPGAYTQGGRGGTGPPTLYFIDTLEDSYAAGTWRTFFEASGPRFAVPRIGGTCTLTLDTIGDPLSFIDIPYIYVTDGNFTILGQMAPGGGCTIVGYVYVEASETIIHHMRFRGTDNFTFDKHDPFNLYKVSLDAPFLHHNAINHVTQSFGKDNIASIVAHTDVTYTNCLIGPQLQGPGVGRGSLVGLPSGDTVRMVYYRTLLFELAERNPWIQQGDVDIVNCLVAKPENFVNAQLSGWFAPMRCNYMGNAMYAHGAEAAWNKPVTVFGSSEGPNSNHLSSIFYDDNFDLVFRPTGTESQTAMVTLKGTGTFPAVVGSRIDLSSADYVLPQALLAGNAVLAAFLQEDGPGACRVRDANAQFVYFRDSLDTTIRSGLGFTPTRGTQYPLTSWGNNVASFGGVPVLASGLPLGPAFDDSNNDGIPDSYSLPAGKIWSDLTIEGWTFLEHYAFERPRYWNLTPRRRYVFYRGVIPV